FTRNPIHHRSPLLRLLGSTFAVVSFSLLSDNGVPSGSPSSIFGTKPCCGRSNLVWRCGFLIIVHNKPVFSQVLMQFSKKRTMSSLNCLCFVFICIGNSLHCNRAVIVNNNL